MSLSSTLSSIFMMRCKWTNGSLQISFWILQDLYGFVVFDGLKSWVFYGFSIVVYGFHLFQPKKFTVQRHDPPPVSALEPEESHLAFTGHPESHGTLLRFTQRRAGSGKLMYNYDYICF